MGNYNHGVWTCNDCLAANKRDENKSENVEKSSSPSTNHNNNKISNHSMGVASKSDVSSNTPRDEDSKCAIPGNYKKGVWCNIIQLTDTLSRALA